MTRRLGAAAGRTSLAFASAVWVLGLYGVVLAEPRLQAVGELSVGYTDNAQSAPDEPAPGSPEKSADGFVIVSPGAVLSSGKPGALHRLDFTHSSSVFFSQTGASSSSNRLGYQGFLELAPRVSMLFEASAVQSAPHTEKTVHDASSSEALAMLPRTDQYLSSSATFQLGEDLAVDWRAWQGAGAAFGVPLSRSEGARTVEARANTGLEKSYRADALGVELTGAHATVENGVGTDGAALGVQRQLLGTAVLRWRHDYGRHYTSSLEAGVLRLQRLESDRGFTHWTGRAGLAYVVEWGEAEIFYAHRVTTNVMLGQSLLVDEAGLRGALPLTKRRELLLATSCGYQRGRLIEEDASLAAHVNVLSADVLLGWRAVDSLSLALRYQHTQQSSDVRAAGLPLSFVRNAVLLTLGLRLPPDRDVPRRYRSPRRVDRSDELRDDARHWAPE